MESAFRGPLPDLTLIETFCWRDGSFVRLAEHMERLERTARALGVAFDRAAIDRTLSGVEVDGVMRVRLTLDRQGVPAVQAMPLPPAPAVWTLRVHQERLHPDDPWLRVKTSVRARYDQARAALPPGVDEWLFLNARGEVCEGTITNLFLKRDAGLLTPPVDSGLLPGVLRRQMLMEGAKEVVLRLEDLERGEILVGNSLRGLAPARLVE